MCAKSGTSASSQRNTWRGVRPWRPPAGHRSVSGPGHVVQTHRILSPIRPSPRSPYSQSQGRARSDPAPDGFRAVALHPRVRPVRFGCRGGYT